MITKQQLKQASKLAVKNLKQQDGTTINALRAMARAERFVPLKEKGGK